MSVWFHLLLSFLLCSTLAFAESIDSATSNDDPFSQYNELYNNVLSAQKDEGDVKRALIQFYSAILPPLRQLSHEEHAEGVIAYHVAESASYDLVKMLLDDKEGLTQDEVEFVERIAVSDAFDSATELTLNLIPSILAHSPETEVTNELR